MIRRAKGEGSIYFDTNRGRWVGAIEAGINPVTGKRRRVKVVGAEGESRSAVTARLRTKSDELDEATPGSPETVGQLVALWRTRAAPKRKSEATLAMTDSLIRNHIDPVLSHRKVSSVTVEDIEALLDARAEDYSKSTLDKIRTILAQSFDFGIRRRHVNWNPARVAELPAIAGSTRQPRALLSDETRSLLNVAANHRVGAWVVVAVTLGLRPGEVSGLVWEAIDFEAARLTVYQALGRANGKPTLKPTKTKRSRTLDLPAATLDALRRHRMRANQEQLLMGDRWPKTLVVSGVRLGKRDTA